MKIDCIIDTCSCIILSSSEFQQSSLLTHFNERSNFNFSREVNLELRDHRISKRLPDFLFGGKKTIRTRKHTMDEYEMRIIGKTLISREHGNNKGEIDNYAVSVDQIHHFKLKPLIYITDDKKARNGFIKEISPAFPAINIWSSFDVILFLYSDNIIPSKDIALEMLQSLIAYTAPEEAKRSEKTTNELTQLKKDYTKYIEMISKLLK